MQAISTSKGANPFICVSKHAADLLKFQFGRFQNLTNIVLQALLVKTMAAMSRLAAPTRGAYAREDMTGRHDRRTSKRSQLMKRPSRGFMPKLCSFRELGELLLCSYLLPDQLLIFSAQASIVGFVNLRELDNPCVRTSPTDENFGY